MQWQGNKDGYSNGRERSFHFGSKEHFICGMISHLGPQMAVADGVALAYQLKKENKVALAYCGDGGTSEGDFHEALNVAAVWDLPVIFLIENNGYGLSTPTHEQYRCESLVDKAKGYGMDGVKIDGNNVLEIFDTIKGTRTYCIEHRKPYLIECTTFRMRGHEEASGTKYVPKELLDEWGRKDPIKNYEQWLIGENILSEMMIADMHHETKNYISDELNMAYAAASSLIPHTGEEMNAVFAAGTGKNIQPPPHSHLTELRFFEAIKQAMHTALKRYDTLVLMGQDIAEYGGAFKLTEGFVEEFGKNRIRNTPICESAIVGAALGLSLEGYKSIVEMQFADFVSVAFNQIVNNLAKIHYRWNQNADVVIRMPTGAGVGAGPFHSQSNEAWFTHVPGLKVVYPSTPEDAKGLLLAAIADPNPVLFFEHKALYRSISGLVPDDYFEIEIGKAKLIEEGSEISIITYGAGVHWALDYATDHTDTDIEILDLRTLAPLDTKAIKQTVAKTGKVLILHEDNLTGGIGGEIAAWIAENCFEVLDAPVFRCAGLDTPIPFNTELEKNFLAQSRLQEYIEKLLKY
jgi:2-oxoisovalerate dehydrogenase E1 component